MCSSFTVYPAYILSTLSTVLRFFRCLRKVVLLETPLLFYGCCGAFSTDYRRIIIGPEISFLED